MMATAPAALASLVGRTAERALARNALLRQGVRLLVLTGPAGIGKTRLALDLAVQLADGFPDGVYIVPLGDVYDRALVLPAIARAMGLPNDGSSPVTERLHAKLAAAQVLLILDHLQHVPAVAPDLVRLLDACPGLRILATNRTGLRAPGELDLALPPLRVPDSVEPATPENVAGAEAVQLLVQRARLADPDFALSKRNAVDVVAICALLAGLPLAIELAAAHLPALSPAALRAQLSSALPALSRGDAGSRRHEQAMRATIAWSDQSLVPATRRLLRRLSVFAGSCDAAAAGAVCGDSRHGQSSSSLTADGLAALLDRALLRRMDAGDEPRYVMPESVREYALEQLALAEESDAMHRRLAEYALLVAEAAAPALRGPGQKAWSTWLESEDPNLRAALRWSLAHDPATALHLAAALWRFWYARGRLREGQRWLEQVLATGVGAQSAARARALHGLGTLVWTLGDLERAHALQSDSLALAGEIGDAWGSAAARGDRAVIAFLLGGDAEHARDESEAALGEFRALGDCYAEGHMLCTLGSIALSQGDVSEAARRARESLAVALECGDLSTRARCHTNLGLAARAAGNPELAATQYREALILAHHLGNQEELLYSLAGVGGVAVDRRQLEHAAQLLAVATAVADGVGVTMQPLEQARFSRDIAATRAGLPGPEFNQAWAAGRSLSLEAAVAEALRGGSSSREPANNLGLSRRELEVLKHLAAGCSDREIAQALFISGETATTHVKNIRRKLGVHSRAAAASVAIRFGLA